MASRAGVKSYRISFDFYITSAVKYLLIANFCVFILQEFIHVYAGGPSEHKFEMWFGLVPSGWKALRIWQPFTYMFLHSTQDVLHIVMNMLMLWMFGRELELVWGRNRFLRYYFLTGFGAGILNVIVRTVPTLWGKPAYDIPTIGASGAIFGIMIACAILFPDRRVFLFPIPIALRLRTVVAIMAALTFLGTFGLGDDKVSHLCHLGGMLIGYLYLRRDSYLFRLRNEVSDWKYQRNRKN